MSSSTSSSSSSSSSSTGAPLTRSAAKCLSASNKRKVLEEFVQPKRRKKREFTSSEIGYKIFGTDEKGRMMCRNQIYAVGRIVRHPTRNVELCRSGFHFCKKPMNCLAFFHDPLNSPRFRFAQVRAYDNIIHSKNQFKSVTNRMKVEKELTRDEFEALCSGWTMLESGSFEHYYNGEVLSLNDQPAIIHHGLQHWYQKISRELHRSGDKPAEIDGNEDTNMAMQWCSDGVKHRDNAPASMSYNARSGTIYLVWKNFGEVHNLVGPAHVALNENGVESETYYIYDQRYTREQWEVRRQCAYVEDESEEEEAQVHRVGQSQFDYKAIAVRIQKAVKEDRRTFKSIAVELMKEWGHTNPRNPLTGDPIVCNRSG